MKKHRVHRGIARAIVIVGIILLGSALGYGFARYIFKVSEKTIEVAKPQIVRTCGVVASELTTDEKIGQLVIVGINGEKVTEAQLAFINKFHIGGVLYLGENSAGVLAVEQISSQMQKAAGNVLLLIAADQEGGNVQRMNGQGFDTIPSANEQSLLEPIELQKKWQNWGEQLRAAGVNYNLAPVADFVDPGYIVKNAPIGQLDRNYGTDEITLVASVQAAIKGLHQARIATAIKHFPGLGAVAQNTDYSSAKDSTTTDGSPSIRIFRQSIENGADSVMVSLATYVNLDPNNQAVFSKAIITDLLRTTLDWNGVVISDDLGTAVAVSSVPVAERGVKFLTAGGDLIIAVDMQSATGIIKGIKEHAASDSRFLEELTTHVARVLKLKNDAGLLACS